MRTIPNEAGAFTVELTIPIARLCPTSAEPQIGSTLTWCYTAGDRLLELKAARAWPAAQQDTPIDLETFTHRAAAEASAALGVPVVAEGQYILGDGAILRCVCPS